MRIKISAIFCFSFGFVFGLLVAKVLFFQNDSLTELSPNKRIVSKEELHSMFSTPTETMSKELDGRKEIFEEEVSQCNVPKLNPWDLSITPWIKHPQNIYCLQVQPYMTYVDYDGYLTINGTETKRLWVENLSFRCTFRTFDRKYGYNDDIWFSDRKTLTLPTTFGKDAVEVECMYDHNETRFYHNVHVHPAVRDDLAFLQPTEDQLSVLFLIIDSVSHSALQRNLPLTYNYTKNVMGIKYFNAFHKIGTNSFPNQMAWFTGRLVYSEEDVPSENLGGEWYTEKKLDSWPLIWKLFSAKSYATAFSEEWPSMGLFHYGMKGFTKKIFDYYYYWFWTRVNEVKNPSSSDYCFSNEPLPKINIDIARRHLKSLKNILQFLVVNVVETTHSMDNEVERIDKDLLEFFQDVFQGGYLNHTVLIFASDHGLRLGDIRGTYLGAMEDRLPFYGLWFPRWFYQKHPQIEANIDLNVHVLSSMFDVYETLQDIANANYDGRQRSPKRRGQSQLYPLPLHRTCREAGISDRWCTCNKHVALDPENNIDATEASVFLVGYINDLLKDHRDKCRQITFFRFNFFRRVEFSDGERKNLLKTRHFFIGIQTNPNNATFEAFLTHTLANKETSTWTLKSGLDRTSRYDIYAKCMDDWWLRHFCSCKE